MPYLNAIADRYVEIWNEPSDTVRREMIGRLYAEDSVYVMFNNEPFVGREAIYKQISVAHRIYVPRGFEFRSSHNALGHHNLMRFGWVMVDLASGEPDMIGSDTVVLDDEGRIRADYQFHEKHSTLRYGELPPPEEYLGDLLSEAELAVLKASLARVSG